MHELNKNFVGNLNKNSESSFSKLKITLKIIDKNLIKNLNMYFNFKQQK